MKNAARQSPSMDGLFKALADPSRRRILDLVRDRPGINVNDLTAEFAFSRFATMKHLRLLEEAGLVVARKEWKEKRLYLNGVPIQMIYDRWLKTFDGTWSASLTKLKQLVEEEES